MGAYVDAAQLLDVSHFARGRYVDSVDACGFTALHYAVLHDKRTAMRVLFGFDANLIPRCVGDAVREWDQNPGNQINRKPHTHVCCVRGAGIRQNESITGTSREVWRI